MIPVLHNSTVVITMIARVDEIWVRVSDGAKTLVDVKSCCIGVQFIIIDSSVIVIYTHK